MSAQNNTIKQLKEENKKLRAKRKGLEEVAQAGTLSNYFKMLGAHMADPGCGTSPVFPSLTPGLAGSVTYPIIKELSGSDSYLIRVKPDFVTPLSTTATSSATAVGQLYGDWDILDSNSEIANIKGACMTYSTIYGQGVNAKVALPIKVLTGSNVNVTLNNFAFLDGTVAVDIAFWSWDGATWSTVSTFQGLTENSQQTLSFAIPAGCLGFRFEVVGARGFNAQGFGYYTYEIMASGPTTFECFTGAENELIPSLPQWEDVLENSDYASIPAMDCLVTFQGTTLKNNGSIVSVNLRQDVPMEGNYYDTLAKKKYDKYEGRLASEGSTEGGTHWHLQHHNIAEYELRKPFEVGQSAPIGYIAIKGADPTQPIKVHVNITVNFRTDNPSFSMVKQPYWADFPLLLYVMRDKVPLVSSNDSHLKKVMGMVKDAGKTAARFALENPEKLAQLLALVV